MSEPPPPPQVSPDGRFYWDGSKWVPMPASTTEPAPTSTSPNAVLAKLKAERSFGFMGGYKVKIEKGYIEVKGAPMNARARVPLEMVELAVVQRSTVGAAVAGQPQLVLIGRGAELGHADLPLGKRKAGEEAAEWINDLLRQHRTG